MKVKALDLVENSGKRGKMFIITYFSFCFQRLSTAAVSKFVCMGKKLKPFINSVVKVILLKHAVNHSLTYMKSAADYFENL